MSLPPLSKGGGLTARHKLLSCCVLLATRPPFYSLNFYAVKTEGLLYTHQPLHFHNLLKSTSTASPYAKLASPRKRGGGLTASQNRYSTSSSFCNLPDCFPNCYTFCRQDGGDCACLEDLKIVLLSISIPTVTARNSFRIVKAGLSEYCTASQKNLSAVPPPPFRGETRNDCDLCHFLHNLYTFWYAIFFRCHFGRVVKP